MNKQEFIDLGLTEEQAKKAEEASKKELEAYIPKMRFDEVNEAKKKAEKDVKERDTQIESLKKSTGDNEELKKQIETLQEQNKTAAKEYADKLKDTQLTTAIKLLLAGKLNDGAEDYIISKFDKSKLILSEDGKVTGADTQLAEIQKVNAFAFKPENPSPNPNTGFHIGGGDPNPNPNSSGSVSLKDALIAKFSQQNT